jgi:DNA primase catalytic subunit
LDLFGTGGPGRPRGAGQSRKRGRPAGRKTVARKAKPRRKGPPKADNFLAKLPAKFTIDDVRKVAGKKATAISLAQWARAKKVKKVAGGYQKVSQG